MGAWAWPPSTPAIVAVATLSSGNSAGERATVTGPRGCRSHANATALLVPGVKGRVSCRSAGWRVAGGGRSLETGSIRGAVAPAAGADGRVCHTAIGSVVMKSLGLFAGSGRGARRRPPAPSCPKRPFATHPDQDDRPGTRQLPCAPWGRATCSSSGSSIGWAGTSPIWSTPCRSLFTWPQGSIFWLPFPALRAGLCARRPVFPERERPPPTCGRGELAS